MGYTQYYSKSALVLDKKTWDSFLQDCEKLACRFKLCLPQAIQFITEDNKKITRDIDIAIGDGLGEGKAPVFDKDKIWFNGVGQDSHETLVIHRDDRPLLKEDRMGDYYRDRWNKEKNIFGFVKTNHKPYDLLVTAVLILYKHHFGDLIEIYTGDGGPEGYQQGLELVNETLSYSIAMSDVYEVKEEE